MDVFSSFYGLIPVTIAQSLIVSFVVLGVMLPFPHPELSRSDIGRGISAWQDAFAVR